MIKYAFRFTSVLLFMLISKVISLLIPRTFYPSDMLALEFAYFILSVVITTYLTKKNILKDISFTRSRLIIHFSSIVVFVYLNFVLSYLLVEKLDILKRAKEIMELSA